MALSQGWKITVMVLAVVGVVSTPLVWLLDSPGAGELAGASVQGVVGITALVWAMFQHPGNRSPSDDVAAQTGQARASGGGRAVAGIRRPGGRGGGSARAEHTGNATATGEGSRAVSGIDYSG